MGMRVSIPKLSGVSKRAHKAAKKVKRRLAKVVVKEVTDNLRQGLKPDGTAQPSNKQSTLKAKRAAGHGATPGVATGVMSTPQRWRISHQGDVTTIRVPPERSHVPRILWPKGYRFEGFPEDALRKADAMLKAAGDQALRNLETEVIK